MKWVTVGIAFAVGLLAPVVGTSAAEAWASTATAAAWDLPAVTNVIHHLVQMAIPLVLMLAWPGRSLGEWGWRTGDAREGARWVLGFTAAWVVLYTVLTGVLLLRDVVPSAPYDVTDRRHLVGELLFRGVVVGPSEETLFRAFPITLMLPYWAHRIDLVRGVSVSQAGMLAAALFALAHVGLSLSPTAVHVDLVQVATAMGLGILYAVVFERTGSVLYPIAIHAVSDVVPVVSLWVLTVI